MSILQLLQQLKNLNRITDAEFQEFSALPQNKLVDLLYKNKYISDYEYDTFLDSEELHTLESPISFRDTFEENQENINSSHSIYGMHQGEIEESLDEEFYGQPSWAREEKIEEREYGLPWYARSESDSEEEEKEEDTTSYSSYSDDSCDNDEDNDEDNFYDNDDDEDDEF